MDLGDKKFIVGYEAKDSIGINDENIVPPPVYVHPKANPKATIVNGTLYLDDILSISKTFSVKPMISDSFIFIKFNTFISIFVVTQII